MKAMVTTSGFETIIERGLMDPDEWTQFKRQIAEEYISDVKQKAPACDEDTQVQWNFRKDWRKEKLPLGTSFGSDFDYWSYVVNDALDMWSTYAPMIVTPMLRDYVAEGKAGWSKGQSGLFYTQGESFAIWENGVKVNRTHKFNGPQIDMGPTADFSVFLERWDHSKKRPPILTKFRMIGVVEAIARNLQLKYAGVHTIFKFPIRPEIRESREIPNRKEAIKTLPLIRVLPRHFLRKR